jgi:hypothetical protein
MESMGKKPRRRRSFTPEFTRPRSSSCARAGTAQWAPVVDLLRPGVLETGFFRQSDNVRGALEPRESDPELVADEHG